MVKKTSDIASWIVKLRGNEKRSAFARKLGVPRTALIAWESGTYKPQLNDCLKMTYLIPSVAEKIAFLEAAGISPLALADLALALEKESVVATGSHDLVLLRPLWGKGKPLPLPMPIATNAASSRYLRVDESLAVLDAELGDILLLDVSGTEASGVSHFLDQRLLVEFEKEPSVSVPLKTYEIGRLFLRRGYEGDLGVTFEAQFYRWADDLHETQSAHEIAAGPRTPSMPMKRLPWDSRLAYPDPKILGTWSTSSTLSKRQPGALDHLFQRAQRELKLRAGVRIIGRLAGWIRPYQAGGTKT